MPDRVIFNVVIPWTDEFTGLVHPLEKLREWFFRTAELCGGGSEVGIGLLGLWYDRDRSAEENPVQDHNNWYKFGVPPDKVEERTRRFAHPGHQLGVDNIQPTG